MPLPIILGIAAAVSAIGGIGAGAHGAKKMKDANDTLKYAKSQQEADIRRLKDKENVTMKFMDSVGEFQFNIMKDFDKFADIIEKIQNRPSFSKVNKENIELPEVDFEELKRVSIGAGVVLGGATGAAAGTTIASLSGAAATNATLATLGGGALAAGGGGMALGTTILGASTLGVGLLVGGVIFSITGKKLSDKADEAYEQMLENRSKVNEACGYLGELEEVASTYYESLKKVNDKYEENFDIISHLVNDLKIVDYNKFEEKYKIALENSVLLVGLLYEMCKVKLVSENKDSGKLGKVNRDQVLENKNKANRFLSNLSMGY